ncbi:M1 family metallopeptidase [Gracilibacillus sp. Marseille-QA3620]
MSKKLIWFSLIILLITLVATLKLISLSNSQESIRNEKNIINNFSPKTMPAGSDSQYNIDLTMNKDGKFNITATININNVSQDSWNDLVFYFIPNIFTEETSVELHNSLEVPSKVHFSKITLDGKQVDYHLEKDTLNIPLTKKLEPGNSVKVHFDYELTLPEGGLRFTKNNENYHLAHFYPMVATYREHNWNKEEYRFRGETYHTGFSDFKVSYDIPKEYTFVSTSETDGYPGESIGTFKVENVKDIFIAILKNPMVIEKQENNINIRVFGFEDKKDFYKEISEVAVDTITYFQENIGPYPFTQLDIVLDGLGMEYPGIVTANSIYHSNTVNPDALKRMVIHEIAHQWFYGIISNDPYHNAWLDEGLANFSTSLYHYSTSGEKIPYKSMNEGLESLKSLPVNLPLDEYEDNMSSYVYGKTSTMLWNLFKQNGGIEEAEKFLKTYYDNYKYKEIDDEEFVRFTKYYFNLKDDSLFKGWLLLK